MWFRHFVFVWTAFPLPLKCTPSALAAPSLECEVCQVLCIMLQDKIEETASRGALSLSGAARLVVAASLKPKKGACSFAEAWKPTVAKVGKPLERVLGSCHKQMQRLEDAFEVALGDPAIRDAQLREKICLHRKKAACESLWPDSEVPRTKQKAERMQNKARVQEEAEGKENDRRATAFFKANKKRAGVKALRSGLQMKVLRDGHGLGPPSGPDVRVTVHYRGFNLDCVPQDGPVRCSGGTEFDSTYSCKEGTPSAERSGCEKNKPISFTSTQAGSFWPEVLSRMREGSELEVYVPYQLAYGANDDPSKRPAKVGARAALIFQIELIQIHEQEPTQTSKAGSKAATAAEFQAISGYDTQYKIVKAGSGTALVSKGNTVSVHATGKVLQADSSEKKFWSTRDPGQQPFTYQAGAGEVIAGWDQGCLGMKKGEERHLEIPSHEGYGAKGFPAWGIPENADLRFEIEVITIEGRGVEL